MSRYHFHMRDFKGNIIEDEEGSELPGLTVAREHALLSMHEFVSNAIRGRQELKVEAVIIADEAGTYLAAVPLIAALPSEVIGLFKQPEKVVPLNRFEEYRRNADGCRTQAENAADADDKTSWLKLADAWLHMLPPTHPSTGDLAGWPRASDEDSKASH